VKGGRPTAYIACVSGHLVLVCSVYCIGLTGITFCVHFALTPNNGGGCGFSHHHAQVNERRQQLHSDRIVHYTCRSILLSRSNRLYSNAHCVRLLNAPNPRDIDPMTVSSLYVWTVDIPEFRPPVSWTVNVKTLPFIVVVKIFFRPLRGVNGLWVRICTRPLLKDVRSTSHYSGLNHR